MRWPRNRNEKAGYGLSFVAFRKEYFLRSPNSLSTGSVQPITFPVEETDWYTTGSGQASLEWTPGSAMHRLSSCKRLSLAEPKFLVLQL